jgi:hypothetical protein
MGLRLATHFLCPSRTGKSFLSMGQALSLSVRAEIAPAMLSIRMRWMSNRWLRKLPDDPFHGRVHRR